MTDAVSSAAKTRSVNIDSAIGHSSYQLPVFVALSGEGSEAQVSKTFATARDVFDHVFSVMLDRLLQRRAVEKVEKLVPASAHLKDSINTEYVLFVRGKAIFWFSGAAAKRAAGRKLLLEHARELADAEQAPFYVLNTQPRRIRAAVIAFGLVSLPVLVVLAWHLPIHRILPFQWRDTAHAAPLLNALGNAGDRRFESGASSGAEPGIAREPVVDIDLGTDATPADEPFPDPVLKPVVTARRTPATPAWPSRMTRAPEAVPARPRPAPDAPLPANFEHTRQNLGTTPDRRGGVAGDPAPQIKGAAAAFRTSLDRKVNRASLAPVVSGTPAPNRPESDGRQGPLESKP